MQYLPFLDHPVETRHAAESGLRNVDSRQDYRQNQVFMAPTMNER